MKRRLALSLTWVALLLSSAAVPLPPEKTLDAGLPYFETPSEKHARFRQALSKTLQTADKVEIFLLGSEKRLVQGEGLAWAANPPVGFFPVVSYRALSKIVGQRILTPAQRKQLLPTLRAVLDAPSGPGMMCHDPSHGMRVWSKETLLFQTSLSWRCFNLYIQYPDGEGWCGIEGKALGEQIQALLPIPKRPTKK